MMASWLVVLALQAGPLDRAEALLEDEKFADALRELERANPVDPRYRAARDIAVKGTSRDIQRAAGYPPALAFLEARLESRDILDYYAEVCIWAGEEQRGLDRIHKLPPPRRKESVNAEFQLLWKLREFAKIERLARLAGWAEGRAWARKQEARRQRFADRAGRAWRIALIAAVVMGVVCLGLHRFLGRSASGGQRET